MLKVGSLQVIENIERNRLVRTDIETFGKIDIRVGKIVRAEPYPEAKKPSIKLWINFGSELGEKKSSAQITQHYTPQTLIGRQIIAVVNFRPRQIGKFVSEVLVLGVPDSRGDGIILLAPEMEAALGGKVH
jgi:tRNA-binding protein